MGWSLSPTPERNDVSVISKHLQALGEEDAQLYRLVGKKVLEVAKLRNPDENYEELETLL